MRECNVTKDPVKASGKGKIILTAVVAALLAVLLFLGVTAWSNNRIVAIKAVYAGETAAGTVLDSENAGIQVIGRTKDRGTVEIPFGEWSVAEPQVLSADTTSDVRIQYKGMICELRVACTDSQAASISASYTGPEEAGTVIRSTAEGFAVTATLRNGKKLDVADACVIVNGPVTLQENKISSVEVSYTDPFSGKVFSTSLNVVCSTKTVRQISAEYTGEAPEGEVLDSGNPNFVVTATYDNGSVERVENWEIREPSVVTHSKSTPVTITYGGRETTVVVECSDYKPETYRKNCTRCNFTELMRYPETYLGAMIFFRGRITQVYESAAGSARCAYRIRANYRQYVDVVFQGMPGEGKLIEGDNVTVYGTFMGMDSDDYGYPQISAKVIDR